MIDRKQALILIKRYIKSENLVQKSLIVETILTKIAKKLGRNEELWGLTGLLHNIDYEYTLEEPEKRGIFAAQILEGLLPENCINAIKSINYYHSDYVPSKSLDKSLIATAAITDFIIAIISSSSLKNMSEVDLAMLKNKFDDSNFTNVNIKKRILLCNDVGMDIVDLLQISMDAIKEASEKI
jgi:predicted hydrolase (HD superfamily)